MASQVIELLHGMDIFADLTEPELNKVARMLKEQKLAENELIFSQGDPGDALYIVLQGRVRIATTDYLGRERVLAFYGPGQFFGDMALLTGEGRSATATASTEARLLQLRKDDFDTLVEGNVNLMRGMLRVMVDRQAAMNTRLTQEVGAMSGDVHGLVTVVFAARGGAGQTTLATNLAVALAQATPDRVVAVDLDLLFGHMAMLLDLVPRTGLAAITPAALRQLDRESLTFYLSQHEESSLRLLAGTMRPEESELVTGEHVRAVMDQLRRHFVHVVVDAGSRFSEPALAAIEAANELVLVSTPEPAAITALLETERVMREVLSVPADRTRVVLNRLQPYADAKTARAALASGRVYDVPYGGEEVGRSALEGLPLVTARSGNAAARAILGLARELEQAGKEALALSPGARS